MVDNNSVGVINSLPVERLSENVDGAVLDNLKACSVLVSIASGTPRVVAAPSF